MRRGERERSPSRVERRSRSVEGGGALLGAEAVAGPAGAADSGSVSIGGIAQPLLWTDDAL